MNNNNDPIKQENKKAMPKFLVIMAGCLIGGGILGLALFFLSIGNLGEALASAGWFFTNKVATWLLIALPLVTLAVCVPIYLGAKKRFDTWDGENEAVSDEIETKVSVCMWIVGLSLIVSFFLLAALCSGFVENAKADQEMPPAMFFGGVAAFMIGGITLSTVFQQRLVDLAKRLYPEKRGSVYDTKFQKKWMESCDEAERIAIGQCAFKAYQAMARTCLGLWLVLTCGGMFFDWGFLPALVVCIIWGVGQSVYSYWALKLSKPGTAL